MTAALVFDAIIFGAISFHGIDLNAIAQTSAVQIVDCLVEGTLIAIFAGLMLGVIRRKNSGTRFAVWFSALMAIAALPLLGGSWGAHAPNISAQSAGSAITVPGAWAIYAFGAWVAIAAWFLLGVGRGLWHLHVLRRSCLPVNLAEMNSRLQETLERNRSTRAVTLCTSDLVRVPTAIGFFKPVIVVPGWVMQELSADEFNQILLHELAHLGRWDDWTNLAQKVVKALFFFHPAVWWIEKKVSLEREMACDDAVIAETASPRAYAECLTHLAEKTLVQRSMALAQAALGRIRQTSLRVAQILDVDRPTDGTRPWKPAVSLVAGFALICMLGISRAPRLIAFRDSASNPIASPMIAAASPRPVGAQVSQAKFVPQPVQVVPASLKARSINRSVTRYVHTASIQSASASAGVSTMVRPSTMRTSMIPSGDVRLTHTSAAPVAFTETLFVVIEGSTNDDSNQPVYQIQWWRVTVLHPVVAPSSNRIPAKQT